jgi:hypothetical protein
MVKKSLLELNSIISSIMVIIIMGEEESIRYLQIIGIQTIMVGMVAVEGIRINNNSTIHHLLIRRNLSRLH